MPSMANLFPSKAIQVGRRCRRLWRWEFRRWGHVLTITYSRYGLNFEPVCSSAAYSFTYHSYETRFDTKHTPSHSMFPSIYRNHSTAQHSTAQHSIAQHSTAQHSTAQHKAAKRVRADQSTTTHASRPSVAEGNHI